MNQKGISSLLLLFMVVLGVFILWEANEFISGYGASREAPGPSQPETEEQEPICLTGETDNCNDSNDVFLLPE